MAKTEEQIKAEKAAAEKAEAEKVAAEKAEAEKAAAEKAEAEKEKNLSKKKYEVAVTGFLALGKMFRPTTKIEYNTYKDYIQKWLDEGLIRVKK